MQEFRKLKQPKAYHKQALKDGSAKESNLITKKKRVPKNTSNILKKYPEGIETDAGRAWAEDYFDVKTLQMKPVTHNFFRRLAFDYLEWINSDPDTFVWDSFYLERNIPRKTFYDWLDRHQELAEVHSVVLSRLATKRENYAAKFGAMFLMRNVTEYSPSWKKHEEWRASLKSDSDKKQEKTVIVLSDLQYKKQNQEDNKDE